MDASRSSIAPRTWIAVALCAALYLYAFPYQAPVNNPNENVRFFMTAAIVEEGTYALDAIRARWGWVNDAGTHDGHSYSVKAPGTSMLGVPAYALYYAITKLRGAEVDRTAALWCARAGASILPMLVFLFFFHRWLGARTRHGVLRDATFLAVALGSLFYGYSLLFVSHAASAASAFGAFMLLYDARRTGSITTPRAFIAGMLAAGVTFFEYPGVVASAVLSALALVVLRPRWRLAPFALGALVPTLAVMHFQWRAFGSPLTPGHGTLENEAWRGLSHQGFFGITAFHPDAAGGLLFDLAYGLFPLTPLLLLAFIGFPRLLRDRDERIPAVAALVLVVGTYVVICFMNIWRGGWTIGPRYIADVVPFLAWAALAGLDGIARRAPRIAAALGLGAAAAGMMASGLPSVYYPYLPENFTRPLPQLIAVLVRHDFAPRNAGSLVGAHGTMSMLPLALVGIGALVWAVWPERAGRDVRAWTERGLILTASLFVASVLLTPLIAQPSSEEAKVNALDALAFVTRSWDPPGHDRAARLEAELRAGSTATRADYERLAELYREEGRDSEAQSALRRAQLAARRR